MSDQHREVSTEHKSPPDYLEDERPARASAAVEPAAADAVGAGELPPARAVKWTSHHLRLSDTEHRQLTRLKERAVYLTGPVKKGDLIRAGIRALSFMGDDALHALLTEYRASAYGSKSNAERRE